MRIIFMGTPDFSVPILKALVDAGHVVACVYCQPPRPSGRGKKLRPTPVHQCADELGLLVRHPTNFKQAEDVAAFRDLKADVAVVVAYGLILPACVLEAPSMGCINIHASLLPRWRGAAPIHRAILAGDVQTGISIMQMDKGLDTGPVLTEQSVQIGVSDTTQTLHDRLSDLGAAMIVSALPQLDDLKPVEQSSDGVTYAAKIDKSEARIDWSQPAVSVDRKIRGLSPFPGAWAELHGERVKFLQSTVQAGDGNPGEVLDDALLVACGEGAIQISQLQRPGKGPMLTNEFLRGQSVRAGDQFS
jgi:methionyl-tRNA formyltransferase